MKTMHVSLNRIGTAAFEATADSGGTLIVDGSPDIGGEGRGMRPMELLLSALSSCAAMDVVHILRKQKEPLENLRVDVEGKRPDTAPAPFSTIKLVFVANVGISEAKFQRAVSLSVSKYCSVGLTLDPNVPVTWEARLE